MYEARHICHSYMWHDSVICVTRLTHMCDMIHSCVRHDSLICVTWLIHMCDMNHSYAWHDSFMCPIIHLYVWGTSHVCMSPSLCVQLPFSLLKPTRQGFIRVWGNKKPAANDDFSYLSFKTESCSSSIWATWQVPWLYRTTHPVTVTDWTPWSALSTSRTHQSCRPSIVPISRKVARDWNQEEEDVREKSRPDPWLGCCTLSPAV